MTSTGKLQGIRRYFLFALMFGPGVLLMLMLGRLGVPSDVRVGLMFVPSLMIFLWNRRRGVDRLEGLAAPNLAFSGFISLGGFAQYKQGPVFELLYLVGATGTVVSIVWVLWFLLFLGGPGKRR